MLSTVHPRPSFLVHVIIVLWPVKRARLLPINSQDGACIAGTCTGERHRCIAWTTRPCAWPRTCWCALQPLLMVPLPSMTTSRLLALLHKIGAHGPGSHCLSCQWMLRDHHDDLTRRPKRPSNAGAAYGTRALKPYHVQASGEGAKFVPPHRTWLMMPFMHSERLEDQQVRLIPPLTVAVGPSCNSKVIRFWMAYSKGRRIWDQALLSEVEPSPCCSCRAWPGRPCQWIPLTVWASSFTHCRWLRKAFRAMRHLLWLQPQGRRGALPAAAR